LNRGFGPSGENMLVKTIIPELVIVAIMGYGLLTGDSGYMYFIQKIQRAFGSSYGVHTHFKRAFGSSGENHG
jgi:hypothetical protein